MDEQQQKSVHPARAAVELRQAEDLLCSSNGQFTQQTADILRDAVKNQLVSAMTSHERLAPEQATALVDHAEAALSGLNKISAAVKEITDKKGRYSALSDDTLAFIPDLHKSGVNVLSHMQDMGIKICNTAKRNAGLATLSEYSDDVPDRRHTEFDIATRKLAQVGAYTPGQWKQETQNRQLQAAPGKNNDWAERVSHHADTAQAR